MTSRARWWVVLVLTACAVDVEVEVTTAALAPPTWTAPACEAAALDSPPDECEGPWLYTVDQVCVGQHTDCGSFCSTPQLCATWDNGIVYQATTEQQTRTRSVRQQCAHPGGGGCTTTYTPSQSPAAWCTGAANTRETELVASVPVIFRPANLAAQIDATGSVALTATGSPTVVISGNKEITTFTETHTCTIAFDQPTPKAEVCGCTTYTPYACVHDCGDTPGLSAPGTALSSLPDPSPEEAVDPGGDAEHVPVCTTCDHVTAPQAKAGCLRDRLAQVFQLPGGNANTALRRSLVARLKLLYELDADRLDAATQTFIIGLYDEVGTTPACHEPLVMTGCSSSQLRAVATSLQACHALTLAHVDDEVRRSQIATCLAATDRIGALAAGACKTTLRDHHAGSLASLLRARFGGITTGAGRHASLVAALRDVDALWEKLAPLGVTDAGWLRARMSPILGDFWAAVHESSLALPETVVASSAETLLAEVTEVHFANDLEVLQAAFDPSFVFDTPPLLYVVADALGDLRARLEPVSELHDLVCRYRGDCGRDGSRPPRATATSGLWSALATLADPVALGQALAAAPGLASHHPALAAALESLRLRHDRLGAAYGAAGGQSLSQLLGGAVPVEAVPLQLLVAEAEARSTAYAATGLFAAVDTRVLHVGVQRKQEITDLLGLRLGALDQQAAQYEQERVGLINALLAQVRQEEVVEGLEDRADVLGQRMLELVVDLRGLRGREADEAERLADFVAAFEALLDAGAVDEGAAAATSTDTWTVSPADAHYTPGQPVDLSALAVRTVSLQAGEMLRLQVRNQWAPMCALSRAQLDEPGGGTGPIQPGNPLVGPEGYEAQWSESGWVSDSATHTEADATTESIGFDLCAGGAIFLYSINACYRYQNSFTETDSTSSSNGTESRLSANFAGGLRLAETPIRRAPAGALVAVVRDASGDHADDVVVERDSVILAPADVTVTFVVNDRAPWDGGCQLGTGNLVIDEYKITPVGVLARAAGDAMAETLALLDEAAPQILAQGAFLSGEAAALRSDAYARLAVRASELSGAPVSLQTLPPAIQGLFTAWLDGKLASLERRAHIRAVDRELGRLLLETDALAHEVTSAGQASRLLRLLPQWNLRELRADRLRLARETLSESLLAYALPVFELRYPGPLADLRETAAFAPGALDDLDFAAPPELVSARLALLGATIHTQLASANLENAGTSMTEVVIALPDPAAYTWPACSSASCPSPVYGSWIAASEQTSRAFWREVRDGGTAPIALMPRELYRLDHADARLSCLDGAPVIRRMALFSDLGSTDSGELGRRLDALADVQQSFPTIGGLRAYVAEEPAAPSLPVLSGQTHDALTTLRASHWFGPVGEGLSPFTPFAVDFSPFPPEHLPNGGAFLVLLEIETQRHASATVLLPGTCPPNP
jgi:hypothetical protein